MARVSAWRAIGKIVRKERPACVVGTGGYASGIALAYATTRTDSIHRAGAEQLSRPDDSILQPLCAPGPSGISRSGATSASRRSARRDLRRAIRSNRHRSRVRIELRRAPRWGFSPTGGRVMLVYGGSQGSKAMNDVVAEWVTARNSRRALHHLGDRAKHLRRATLRWRQGRVKIRPYLSPVSEAYAAADFALSRGGAMATAELCAWGIPPIVVPLPTAAADHQTSNAIALASAGAGEIIPQTQLTADSLDRSVRRLLDEPGLLEKRSLAALARARPHAAEEIARSVLRIRGVRLMA